MTFTIYYRLKDSDGDEDSAETLDELDISFGTFNNALKTEGFTHLKEFAERIYGFQDDSTTVAGAYEALEEDIDGIIRSEFGHEDLMNRHQKKSLDDRIEKALEAYHFLFYFGSDGHYDLDQIWIGTYFV
jgi:hypothetical protein